METSSGHWHNWVLRHVWLELDRDVWDRVVYKHCDSCGMVIL